MKKITVIGLLLIVSMVMTVPVNAQWSNGNYYTDEQFKQLTDGDRVVCTGIDGDRCSKYRDNNPADSADVWAGENTCNLRGQIRAGYTTLTPIVYMSNDANPNKTPLELEVMGNGQYEYFGLARGNYTLFVPDGNGGQPESTTVTCAGSGDVFPLEQIIGHAVSASDQSVCYRTIMRSVYGGFEERCGEPYTVHHGDYAREWVPKVCHGFGWSYHCHEGYWDYDYVGTGNGDYVKNCGRHSCSYEYVAPTQEQDCETVGGSMDVTSNVASVVASGKMSFVFDNAQNPGGIFDTTATALLSEINDPASGILKSVSIDYKDCSGIERHVTAEEHQQITLL